MLPLPLFKKGFHSKTEQYIITDFDQQSCMHFLFFLVTRLLEDAAIEVTCISLIRRRVASDLESECTTESSSDSSARINICRLRVSNQLMNKVYQENFH